MSAGTGTDGCRAWGVARVRRRSATVRAGVLMLVVGASLGGAAPRRAFAQAGPAPIATAVAGIISFTRWPAPVDRIVLCVVGPVDEGDALLGASSGLGGPPVQVRQLPALDDIPGECNAVYAGRLGVQELGRLNQGLKGRAVLTMGDATPDCTGLIMFCLRQNGAAVTFSTNIDMISRGGVRINPRVLQLGRTPPP